MTLKEGATAPDFSLLGDDGKSHRLKDHRGDIVVLYFYPKDLTPGCTTEACEFNDALDTLGDHGAVVFGVSKDSLASHARFKTKHDLAFTLLSDPDLDVHKTYGAYGEKSMYGRITTGVLRTTYVINKDGKVAKVWPKVRVKDHVKAVTEFVKKLDGQDAKLMSSKVRAKK